MAGIDRIHIESNWDDDYTKINKSCEPTADKLYLSIFENIRMPLADKTVEIINCTKSQAAARYDWVEGIDVILHFLNGTKATLQEKFLTYKDSTVTFETIKGSGEKGAWYYCTAQYYFVGYARRLKEYKDASFQDWVMIDLPGLHRTDSVESLKWFENKNNPDKLGRKAKFKYLYFDHIPTNCIIARYKRELKKTVFLPPSLFEDF